MAERVEDPYDQLNPNEKKRYVSERGPFEIWENPEIKPSFRPEAIDVDKAADGFEYGALAENCGEEPVRRKIGEMLKSYAQGTSTTPLFVQGGPTGMSLYHVWFGPNLPLFRHSHPRFGDCLYYVVAGELILGNRRLGPVPVSSCPTATRTSTPQARPAWKCSSFERAAVNPTHQA